MTLIFVLEFRVYTSGIFPMMHNVVEQSNVIYTATVNHTIMIWVSLHYKIMNIDYNN